MKKFVIAAASAVLLASTAIVSAQEAQPAPSAEELIKKPGAKVEGEAKGSGKVEGGQAQGTVEGQGKVEGQAQGTTETAPGEQPAGQAQGEQQPSTETTGSININNEQRTEITQIFRSEKVDRIDVDFDINVGVAVPRTVVLRPLPVRVIEIVPAYRGYEYFVLADGRIIIVEPGTLKIVYILVV